MRALVLCAGFGKRLGALCESVPKPLLEVGGAPIAAHILRSLAAHGVRDVVMNLHHRAEQFRPRLGDGSAFGVRLTYRHESQPLGTAGTSRHVLAEGRADGELLVHYGDILTDHDLGALVRQHRATGAAATILVHQRAGSNSHAELAPDRRVTTFIERPATPLPPARESWVFSGICVLAPQALTGFPPADTHPVLDLPRDVFPALVAAGTLYAQPLAGYRCAIDSEARLATARADFASGRFRPMERQTAAEVA